LSDTVIATSGLFIDSITATKETCHLKNGSIELSIQNGSPPFSFTWNNENSSGNSLSNLYSGYYYITVTDQNMCFDTATVFIDQFDIQTYIETINPSICGQANGNVLISIEGGSGNYQINWFNIIDFVDQFAFNLPSGSYMVSIQDQNCIDSLQFTINEINKPIACFEFTNSSGVLIDQSFLIQNCSQFATQYHWDFGDGITSTYTNPSHSYGASGTKWITLIASNEYNCKDSITQSIVVHEISSIYIPNSFTPNGDGLNDIFVPVCYFVNENGFSLKIFNRWGQEIFASYQMDYGWNGKIGTSEAPQGSYSYIIMYENIFGQVFRKTGVIQLIR
jgi:gliding motility-associated-like protein